MSKPDDLETSSISKISEISKLQKDNTNLKTELQWHKEELATVREKLRKTEEDLEALSHAYSAIDQMIWMNRLLRTCSYVLVKKRRRMHV